MSEVRLAILYIFDEADEGVITRLEIDCVKTTAL